MISVLDVARVVFVPMLHRLKRLSLAATQETMMLRSFIWLSVIGIASAFAPSALFCPKLRSTRLEAIALQCWQGSQQCCFSKEKTIDLSLYATYAQGYCRWSAHGPHLIQRFPPWCHDQDRWCDPNSLLYKT